MPRSTHAYVHDNMSRQTASWKRERDSCTCTRGPHTFWTHTHTPLIPIMVSEMRLEQVASLLSGVCPTRFLQQLEPVIRSAAQACERRCRTCFALDVLGPRVRKNRSLALSPTSPSANLQHADADRKVWAFAQTQRVMSQSERDSVENDFGASSIGHRSIGGSPGSVQTFVSEWAFRDWPWANLGSICYHIGTALALHWECVGTAIIGNALVLRCHRIGFAPALLWYWFGTFIGTA